MHVDMDCFFAAVATLGRPELRGLPVAVSWSSGAKGAGELSSCNYEARAFGCRAGGRVADALRRCPNLVVMPYEFEKYSAVALEVYRILHDVTPHVMGVSVDEAYIDVTALVTGGGRSSKADSPTGTPETKRTPKELAEFVRERVRDETGCVASVGIGPNRLIARLATMRAKPNGVFEVSLNEAEAYVASLPVRQLPGVGRGALEKLSAVVSPAGDVKNEKNGKEANACIACRDVLRVPSERLQRALGRKSALSLVDACRGIDRRDWVSRPPRKSVGAQVTWGVRFDEASEVVAFAAKLAGEVSARAVRLKVKGRCLTVKVLRAVANVPDGMMKGSVGHGVCDHLTRSVTLSSYADGAETLAREAMNILAALAVPAGEIRGMGLQLSKLDSDPASASRGASDLRRTARLHAKPAGRRTEWAERGEAIERRYAGWFDGGGARLKTKSADLRDSRRDESAKKWTSPRGKANAYAEAMDSAMGDDLSRGLVAALARGSRSRKRAAEEATDANSAEEKKGRLSRDAASSDSSGDEDEPPVSLRRAHAAASRAHAHGVFVETGDIADDALKNTDSVTLESRLKASAASTLRECESFALKRASSVFEKKGPRRSGAGRLGGAPFGARAMDDTARGVRAVRRGGRRRARGGAAARVRGRVDRGVRPGGGGSRESGADAVTKD
jgi:DNA repair protein REV1